MGQMNVQLIHPTAERIVAASIAKCSDETYLLLALTSSADFSSAPLYVVVESVRRLYAGVEPIDVEAILGEAKKIMKETGIKANINEQFLHELITTDTRRAVAYAHTVHRMAWLRQFQSTVEWANAELATLPDPGELYHAAQEKLAWLRPQTKENRFVLGWDTAEYDEMLAKRAREAAEGKAVVFDWPWQSWNQRIKPLRPGMVGIVAGPEGSGKSGYLSMIAEHWARMCHVVYVHLEDNLDYVCDRRMSRWAHIEIEVLESGALNQSQREAVANANKKLSAIIPQLHYFDASGLTMNEIVSELETRRLDGICDAVVVDYLNKVRPSRGQAKLFNRSDERQSDDMEQFKAFCEAPRKKTVGFTAAQYNKEGKANHARKSSVDMRGSGEWADKCQLLVMLDRTTVEKTLKDPSGKVILEAGEDDPTIKVRVEKQNRGRKSDFEQVHVGKFFEIKDKYHETK
jgi:replicative DNA helicase